MIKVVINVEHLVRNCALGVLRRFLVRLLCVLVIDSIVLRCDRLAAASAYASVARAVIMASNDVLVMEVDVADLNDVPRRIILALNVLTGRNAAAEDDGRLIAVR